MTLPLYHEKEVDVPEPVDTPEKVAVWIASNDAQTKAWWEGQRQYNAETAVELATQDKRITALERRLIWAAGAAAGVGGLLGPLLTWVIRTNS